MSRPHMDFCKQQLPNSRQAMHRHADWRLVLILDGGLIESEFGRAGKFGQLDFIIRPAFSGHTDVAGACGVTYIQLPISVAAVRRHIADFGWKAIRGRATDEWAELVANGSGDALTLAATDAAYAPIMPRSALERAASRLAAGQTDELSAEAESMGLKPYQFSREFARHFGMTPTDYRRQARLHRAMALLATSFTSMGQIAALSGYFDQSHLTRELKRETGLTPAGFAAAFR